MHKDKGLDLVKLVLNSGLCLTEKGKDVSMEEIDELFGINPESPIMKRFNKWAEKYKKE